jgi:undecaprenyl-diphosphatase
MIATVRSFVSRHAWSLSLAGLAAVAFARLAREIQEGELGLFDQAAADWLVAERGRWDLPMVSLTRLGTFSGLSAVCVSSALLLAALGRRRDGVYLLVCGAGAGLWCDLLKLFFHRARPNALTQYLVKSPHSFSFPSGHAMGSAAVFGSIVVLTYVLRLPRAWRFLATAIGVSLALGVAASRVYLGVHYPSDVVGGQLAAAAWVAAVTGWFYPRRWRSESARTGS